MKTIFKCIIGMFLSCWQLGSYAQVDVSGISGHVWSSGYYVGWASSNNLDFKINGSQHMVIEPGGDIGIGTTTPGFRVDVAGGDIHINDGDRGYMIDQEYVLWNNNDVSNIYVGVGAGLNDGAFENTFIGGRAGRLNTTGEENTFVGYQAGDANVGGDFNTFVGSGAGQSNNTGEHNVFIGEGAGLNNTTGLQNVFLGANSGLGNTTGDRNTCVGEWTALGTGNLDYATAIGNRSIVTQSNSLVLGAIQGINSAPNNTNVGIGVTAPARRLEIRDDTDPQLRLTQSLSPAVRTDFHTTGNGDLLIAPSSAGTARRTGINFTSATSPAPQQTLDVNGTAAIRTVAQNNSATEFLVWNSGNGLIEHRDFSSFGTGTVGACAAGTTNTLTKWCNGTDIENSLVVDNGNEVGVVGTFPLAKFTVVNATNQYGGFAATNRVTSVEPNVGFWGSSVNSEIANIGVFGTANYSAWSTTNVGVFGIARNAAHQNVAGVFSAENTCSFLNIGVQALGNNTCGGIGYAGYFVGTVVTTGDIFDNGSDIKLKDSVQDIDNALSVIKRLTPKHYVFKRDTFPRMNLPEGLHYGFIAQEMDTVLPALVSNLMFPSSYDTTGIPLNDTMGYLGINYTGLIPIAIAGLQEQQAIIDTIRNTQVTADATGATDSNRVVKWSFTDRKLTNSLLYDDGVRLGLPTVEVGSYLNVQNPGGHSVGLNVGSTDTSTTAVIRARYTNNGGSGTAAAISGYSKYTNAASDDDGYGGRFEGGKWGAYSLASGSNSEGMGLVGESMNATDRNYGVMGASIRATSADNFGVIGRADSSEEANGGVIGIAEYVNATSVNIGVSAFAGGSSNANAAGEFEAWDTAGINYGIIAYANGSAPDAYAGYFDGDVHATGTVTWTSDATLKQQVEDVNGHNALSLINRLQPKTYTFRTADYPYLSLPQGPQYGLLAQDVEQVIPELVKDIIQPERRDRNGNTVSPSLEYKGLNYAGLIPVLIGAVKQQQVKIDSLTEVINNRLTELENRINGCCGTGDANKTGGSEQANAPHQLTVELSSTQVIILEQNVPNPFAEQTSISYFIPENITSAQMVFTDILGNTIKTADVKSGYGTVTVFASNLTSGQYSYSLVIDGKVVETKRMVKTK